MTHPKEKAGGRAGRLTLAAALCTALAGPAPAAEGVESETSEKPTRPSQVEVEGISLGMPAAVLDVTLQGNGFRPSPAARRRYVDDTGDVKKRVRYRELPDAKGVPSVWELGVTTLHPPEQFDPDAARAEFVARYGEPLRAGEPGLGSYEMVYVEHPGAPDLHDVAEVCMAEVKKKDPELSEEEVEKRAYQASSYTPDNDRLEKVCPGASSIYGRFAEALEAPRMTIVIRSARVDTKLLWPRLEADLIRLLGRVKATRVAAGLEPVPEELREEDAAEEEGTASP